MVGVGGRIHVKRCGCCRKRKVKCDGKTPACQRCIDHGLQCLGYEKKLEFIYFDGQNQVNAERSESQTELPLIRTRKQQPTIASRGRAASSHSGVDESRPPHNFPLAPTNNLLVHSLAIPQNKLGLIAVLHGRHVPEYHDASNREGLGMCASWITTAYGLVSRPGDSEMLTDSLLAMSFSLIGPERRQNELSMSGVRHYSKALKGLQTKLACGALKLDDDQMDASLITCLACGMYDVIANHSYSSLLRHLEGIGALLQARGVKNITNSSSRRTFYEFRSIKLSMDLATRRACFLSMPEWINPPWKAAEPHSATNLQTASDIAFRIPLVMEQFDHIRSLTHMRGPIVEWNKDIAHDLTLETLGIHSALEDWGSRINDPGSKLQYYTSRPASITGSPAIDAFKRIYPISFAFPNWDNAAAFAYHAMSQIYTNSLLIDLERLTLLSYSPESKMVPPQIETRELMDESIECADRICKSVEYFLEDNKRLIGRMVVLAPLEAARSLFSQLETGTGDAEKDTFLVERVRFCEAVIQRIKDSGLPIG